MKKFIEAEKAIKIVFSLIPEEIQNKTFETPFGEIMSFKEYLIEHWEESSFHKTRYKIEKDLKRMILFCLSEYWEKHGVCALDGLFV